MSSPRSSSSGKPSSAFDQLHERVRRWIWSQNWSALRDIQEAAIPAILPGEKDVIISSGTASGKTEAAFLPICSRLADEPGSSIRALYIGPTKALINDQFERLDELCESLQIPVHRRHGDVAQSRKAAALKNPAGIMLITPESTEALFVQGLPIGRLFASLGWVVIDELHAFIGSERGRQLQALLHRLELALRRRVPRVGLSATLGDPALAAEFLRPGRGSEVETISSAASRGDLKAQVRGYVIRAPRLGPTPLPDPAGEDEAADPREMSAANISEHLYRTLRGSNNLVFANSRARVEAYADRLRRMCERLGVPNEFWPHHGNLSKEFREEAERALKEKARPTTVVATTTLEMGIDVGVVKSVAQVGVPPSVSSLRQRLGRSGRRGEPAILRMYIEEHELSKETPWPDRLRLDLVTATAMLDLLIQGWCEPPSPDALHASTLVQQCLSIIAQHGGASARELFGALCESGPFRGVDRSAFARLLKRLGDEGMIVQSSDGTLLLGEKGERVVNHYSFYAAFASAEEYRLECAGRHLGSIPISQPLVVSGYLIFAGTRWRIEEIHEEQKLVILSPAPAGRIPHFESQAGGHVHDRIRERMKELLASETEIPFLDPVAKELLAEGRREFKNAELASKPLRAERAETDLFVWKGDRVVNALFLALRKSGFEVTLAGPVVTISGAGPEEVRRALVAIESDSETDGPSLAEHVENLFAEKYDWSVARPVLLRDYAARHLDVAGMRAAVHELLAAL